MRFLDTDRWNEIWQTIARNKKRSIMTALGVFWGIFMLVVMLGAGQGLERISRAAAGGIAINTLMVQPVQTSIPYKGCLLTGGGCSTTTTWKRSANSTK